VTLVMVFPFVEQTPSIFSYTSLRETFNDMRAAQLIQPHDVGELVHGIASP
jgi:hypothetical protein